MKWEYSFTAWPDETSPRNKQCPEMFQLFKLMANRIVLEFTEKEFNDFRENLSKVNITLREIERIPYQVPEYVR